MPQKFAKDAHVSAPGSPQPAQLLSIACKNRPRPGGSSPENRCAVRRPRKQAVRRGACRQSSAGEFLRRRRRARSVLSVCSSAPGAARLVQEAAMDAGGSGSTIPSRSARRRAARAGDKIKGRAVGRSVARSVRAHGTPSFQNSGTGQLVQPLPRISAASTDPRCMSIVLLVIPSQVLD